MTSVEILKLGKFIISDPTRWCQRALAKDADGNGAYMGSEDQCCSWCSIGVLNLIEDRLSCETSEAWDALAIAAYTHRLTVQSYNDLGTHEEVIAMWDHAIQLAE